MAYYRGITNIVPLQLHKNNYFNIAKARRERAAEETRVCVCLDERAWSGGVGRERKEEERASQESTSEREYGVDA